MLSAHSFLLLKDKPPGSLVVGSYCGHTHLWYARLESVDLSANEVVPLTEDECVLLDAIGNRTDAEVGDCYTVYNTPGKLAWGVGLMKSLQGYLVPGCQATGHRNHCLAVVRSVIPVQDPYGERRLFGVQIKVVG